MNNIDKIMEKPLKYQIEPKDTQIMEIVLRDLDRNKSLGTYHIEKYRELLKTLILNYGRDISGGGGGGGGGGGDTPMNNIDKIFQEIKDYDFKEKHFCAYNDGECDCQCFIQGLNVALNIISKYKSYE